MICLRKHDYPTWLGSSYRLLLTSHETSWFLCLLEYFMLYFGIIIHITELVDGFSDLLLFYSLLSQSDCCGLALNTLLRRALLRVTLDGVVIGHNHT